MEQASSARRLFSRGTFPEAARVGEILRAETTGGLLLIAAAVVALVWANSPGSSSYATCATSSSARRPCTST